MTTNKKIGLSLLIFAIVMIIVLASIAIALFVPYNLSNLVELDGIESVNIISKQLGVDYNNPKIKALSMDVNQLKDIISNTTYNNRFINTINDDPNIVKITYKNGNVVLVDSYEYTLINSEGKIIKEKRISMNLGTK